jgi:hypothetical protein
MHTPARSWPWFYALILIVAVVATRFLWLDHDLWSLDEGSTFTMAQQVLEGDVLYRDAADNRSPLMPYLKAAIFAVFGDWNSTAVHRTIAVMLGVVAFLLGWIATKLDGRRTGIATAAIFVFLQIFYVHAGDTMSANTEWFVVIFSTAAFALFAGWIAQPGFRRGLPIGFLFSLSVLCKQPGLLDGIVVFVLLALIAWFQVDQRKGLFKMASGIAVGIVVPFALVVGYFIYHGAYEDYVYYAFTFNTAVYLPEVPFWERMLCIRMPFVMAWENVAAIGLLAIIGAVGLLNQVSKHAFKPASSPFPLLPWLTLGWTAAGLITTTLSGREFAHYSQQVIPGLSLAAGWMLVRLPAWMPRRLPKLGQVALLAFAVTIVVQGVFRFGEIKTELDIAMNDRIDIPDLIRAHSAPDERIFVWGYFPELYFHAKRLPATRYIYANYITGMIAWSNLDALQDVEYGVSPDGWEKFYQDFESTPPAVIVDTQGVRGYSKFPIENREPLWTQIKQNYAEVSVGAKATFGMRIFRQLENITGSTDIISAQSPHPDFTLTGFITQRENNVPRIEVHAPSGYNQLALIIDGRIVSRLNHPESDELHARLFVPGNPFEAKQVWVRATGPAGVADSPPFNYADFVARHRARSPRVPALKIEDTLVPPHQLSSGFVAVPAHANSDRVWDLLAPAHLRFDCPAGVDRVTFAHGLKKSSRDFSDGYDVTVRWIPDTGLPQIIWQRSIKPRKSGQDQMPQTEEVSLPPRGSGDLEFRFTTGEASDPDSDHLYFGNLVGHTQGPILRLGHDIITALPPPTDSFQSDPEGNWLLHVPSRVEWERPANLMSLSFEYGLLPGAYTSEDGHSDGVQFTLELVPEVGPTISLFDQILEPFNHPAHRGRQRIAVNLPQQPQGHLVLTTGPGRGSDSSWDWAFAARFVGKAPGPPIVISPARQLLAVETSGHEGGWADQFDATHWGAQSPQELTYTKPADLTAVTFSYGLNDNAARDENGQRRTDGVEVVVIFAPDQGPEQEIYRRFLDPFVNSEDAGKQTARITLPLGQSGQLKFQMNPGPYGSNAYDWAYWGPFEGETVAGRNSQ